MMWQAGEMRQGALRLPQEVEERPRHLEGTASDIQIGTCWEKQAQSWCSLPHLQFLKKGATGGRETLVPP
jgi:hypothetical protein